jgi:uncharacterized protein YdeI (BOF family)
MKKLLLLLIVTLAFSFTALAQGAGGSTGQSTTTTEKTTKSKKSEGGASAKGAKEQTITGCLAKTDSGYTLTNGRYKKGVPVKTSEDWSAHNGHTVQLTGKWDKSTTPATFDASKMKHISGTCAAGGAKSKAKTEKGEMGGKKEGKSSGSAAAPKS